MQISKKKRKSRRLGRPFTGKVTNKKGKEDNVILRRSIFRQLRKLYGREDYIGLIGN